MKENHLQAVIRDVIDESLYIFVDCMDCLQKVKNLVLGTLWGHLTKKISKISKMMNLVSKLSRLLIKNWTKFGSGI